MAYLPAWLRNKEEKMQDADQLSTHQEKGEKTVVADFDSSESSQAQAAALLASLGLRFSDLASPSNKWVRTSGSIFKVAAKSKEAEKYVIHICVLMLCARPGFSLNKHELMLFPHCTEVLNRSA